MAAPLKVCTNLEQRSVIRFLLAEGLKPIDIHRRMAVQYGESCLSRTQVYEWAEKFKQGVISVQDSPTSRTLCLSVTENNIARVDMGKQAYYGQIPNWLKGSLVRVGPGKFDLGGDFVVNHWLDGFSVLHKFDIKDGKVKFMKKFLQSDAYKKAVSIERPVFTEFGTKAFPDPCKSIFSRLMSGLVPDLTDNTTNNLFTVGDEIYSASETNYLRKIDPKTLETKDKVDLTKLVGVHLASSHPLQDKDGTSYNLGSSFTSGLKYHIFKFPSTPSGKAKDSMKKATVLATISSSWLASIGYYHSFGMSENYIVFIEQPMLMNGMKLLTITTAGRSLHECMEWKPNERNTFFVVEKSTGKVINIKYKAAEPFFVLHHINTYEEDGQLVVDIDGFDSPEFFDRLYLAKLRASEFPLKDRASGRRFVLPLSNDFKNLPMGENLVTLNTSATAVKKDDTIYVTSQTLSHEIGYECPTINRNYLGKKYRYYYANSMYDPGSLRNCIVKVDTETGDIKTWKQDEYTFPGEVMFVQNPGTTEDDDGIVLSAVTDVRQDENNFLLILNAKDFTEIARAEVTVHIPAALHGLFLS